MPSLVQNLGNNIRLVVRNVRSSSEAKRLLPILGASNHSIIYEEYPIGSYVDSSGNLLDAADSTIRDRLIRVQRAFTNLSLAVRTYWPTKAASVTTSNQAITATRVWIYHMCAAMYHMINNVNDFYTDANIEQNLLNLESFSEVNAAGVTTVYVWYRVMIARPNFRNGWRTFSIGDGAFIYTDFTDRNGVPRTVDGNPSFTLLIDTQDTIATIPANFDPEEDGLIRTPL